MPTSRRFWVQKTRHYCYGGRAGGHPVRGIKNKFARNVRKLEADPCQRCPFLNQSWLVLSIVLLRAMWTMAR